MTCLIFNQKQPSKKGCKTCTILAAYEIFDLMRNSSFSSLYRNDIRPWLLTSYHWCLADLLSRSVWFYADITVSGSVRWKSFMSHTLRWSLNYIIPAAFQLIFTAFIFLKFRRSALGSSWIRLIQGSAPIHITCSFQLKSRRFSKRDSFTLLTRTEVFCPSYIMEKCDASC